MIEVYSIEIFARSQLAVFTRSAGFITAGIITAGIIIWLGKRGKTNWIYKAKEIEQIDEEKESNTAFSA